MSPSGSGVTFARHYARVPADVHGGGIDIGEPLLNWLLAIRGRHTGNIAVGRRFIGKRL